MPFLLLNRYLKQLDGTYSHRSWYRLHLGAACRMVDDMCMGCKAYGAMIQ